MRMRGICFGSGTTVKYAVRKKFIQSPIRLEKTTMLNTSVNKPTLPSGMPYLVSYKKKK